jgi:hypothetical protein
MNLDEMDDDRIAIYIDVTLGNPLKAKKIVRYIMYGTQDHDSYDPGEITYYHAPFCKLHYPKQRLTISYWPPGLGNRGLTRTHVQCHIVRKGWLYSEIRATIMNGHNPPDSRDNDSIDLRLIHDHARIIDMFNITTYFYCYDPCCFLVIMAIMCGCIVIQHPVPGYSAEEWMHATGLQSLNGIAYGRKNMAHAEATIGAAYEDCMKMKQIADASVDSFIRDMETGNYTTEPCYRFNDSPYAMQHGYRE